MIFVFLHRSIINSSRRTINLKNSDGFFHSLSKCNYNSVTAFQKPFEGHQCWNTTADSKVCDENPVLSRTFRTKYSLDLSWTEISDADLCDTSESNKCWPHSPNKKNLHQFLNYFSARKEGMAEMLYKII